MNNDVLRELKNEEKQIRALRAKLERRIDKAPAGSLRINGIKGGKPQFYQYQHEDKGEHINGIYISKDKYDVALRLAQKGYDAKLLEWAKRAEYRLDNLIDSYEDNPPETIYKDLSDVKRKMVVPYCDPDDMYIEKWINKWHCGENTFEKKDIILTERGEQVRSKSEKIIADKLFTEGIPYVYEPEVVLDDGERVYPDFAVLNIRNRKEYLFEHFGKMDELSYCRKNIRKIEDYALSGYLLGDGLLATFETNGNMFNPKYLDAVIKRYLK